MDLQSASRNFSNQRSGPPPRGGSVDGAEESNPLLLGLPPLLFSRHVLASVWTRGAHSVCATMYVHTYCSLYFVQGTNTQTETLNHLLLGSLDVSRYSTPASMIPSPTFRYPVSALFALLFLALFLPFLFTPPAPPPPLALLLTSLLPSLPFLSFPSSYTLVLTLLFPHLVPAPASPASPAWSFISSPPLTPLTHTSPRHRLVRSPSSRNRRRSVITSHRLEACDSAAPTLIPFGGPRLHPHSLLAAS